MAEIDRFFGFHQSKLAQHGASYDLQRLTFYSRMKTFSQIHLTSVILPIHFSGRTESNYFDSGGKCETCAGRSKAI